MGCVRQSNRPSKKVRQPDPSGPKTYCYCISNGRAVKVGVSVDVDKRLKDLQTSCPDKLLTIARVSFPNRKLANRAEGFAHEAWSKNRIHGEWFEMETALDFIARFPDSEILMPKVIAELRKAKSERGAPKPMPVSQASLINLQEHIEAQQARA